MAREVRRQDTEEGEAVLVRKEAATRVHKEEDLFLVLAAATVLHLVVG